MAGRTDEDVTVVDDPAHLRYLLRTGDEQAGELLYADKGTRRTLIHTEIDPAFEGRGFGSRLAAAALADARRRGLTVVPECPFVISYLRRHPDELDVVDERHRALILRG
jgi:predicted GNAT family acetyltransferase